MADWTIDVQDFQSIKKAHVVLKDGINIITGKTNSGKSAIFRAIDEAIFNLGNDDHVRVGKNVSGVTINNGSHTMVYCRNAKGKNEKTAYKFDDGTVQRKVGRAQLPEVVQMFGIKEVKMQNNVKMKLNFWYQNDRPFLMDKTSGQLYEFLTLSSCDRYTKVLKQMTTDIKILEAEMNNSNITIDTLKTLNLKKQDFIDKNKGFDSIYSGIMIAKNKSDELDNITSVIKRLSEIRDKIASCKEEYKEVCERYNSIPFEGIQSSYKAIVDRDRDIVSSRDAISKVKSLNTDMLRVEEKTSRVVPRISTLDRGLKSCAGSIKLIEDSVELISSTGLSIERLNSLKSRIDNLKSKIDNSKVIEDGNLYVLGDTMNSLELEEISYNKMTEIFKRIRDIKSEMKSLESSTDEIEDSLDRSSKELEDFKNIIGYCPFCGSLFGECKH